MCKNSGANCLTTLIQAFPHLGFKIQPWMGMLYAITFFNYPHHNYAKKYHSRNALYICNENNSKDFFLLLSYEYNITATLFCFIFEQTKFVGNLDNIYP